MSQTSAQYDQAIASCRDIFIKKTKDYGTAWRVLRIISVVDQIFIKALRIRTIQDKGIQKVGDDIKDEFKGIINYSVIGLIQLKIEDPKVEDMPVEQVQSLYQEYVNFAKSTMMDKNHDYGEAWRDMRMSSLTDLILMKIFRVKQIEDNKGQTTVSEGVDANYMDMLNYSVFALIKIKG
jgi:hypothetical protein